MTKALVINPPFLEPHRPPISAAILAEILRLKQFSVTVKDFNIELYRSLGNQEFHRIQINHTTAPDDVSDSILKNHAIEQCQDLDLATYDWILITCFSMWNILPTEQICELIRSRTKSKIVVGGPGISYQSAGKKMLERGLVDFYVDGEAEHALPELLSGNRDFPGINGIPPRQIDDIEPLPLPNYGYFDLERYDWLLDAPDVFIYGSRGCVRKCTFCDVERYWPKFRWRSGQSIANEMINNWEQYGIKNFFFSDSLVNGNLKEFTIMCEILAKYKEGLFRWGSYAIVRPKISHPASVFDLIKASGGKFWSIGIESGVDRIRFEMQKKFTNDDIDWHLAQSQRIGLQNNFLCIPTWPSETLQEHQEYLNMFPRWQNYAVDGTIFGIRISSMLNILEGTRLEKQQGSLFEFENFDHFRDPDQLPPYFKGTTWKSNDTSHKEKFRRTLALYEAAIEHDWPLTNCLQSLNELKRVVDTWSQIMPVQSCAKNIIQIKSL
jgi:Radical SAM superfamily